MQQYTPSLYSTYGTAAYPARASTKIPSPNTYLSSSYATNNNTAQFYSTYSYNNFPQFGGTQPQDYPGYYNDQYNNYYNATNYSPYVSSPGSSSSQNFHIAALPESPSETHSGTPSMLAHSPTSPLSISPNTNSQTPAKSTPSSKGKARGRKQQNASPTRTSLNDAPSVENVKPPERVFIWDLDETIIIFHTLLTGGFANRYNKVIKLFVYIWNKIITLI